MKNIVTIGTIPESLEDMVSLLDEFCKGVTLENQKARLAVQFSSGFLPPEQPVKLLIHSLLSLNASTTDDGHKQVEEIRGRHVIISTDFTKFNVVYKEPERSQGTCDIPAEDFYEMCRLNLGQQIVNFIFSGKNPFTSED